MSRFMIPEALKDILQFILGIIVGVIIDLLKDEFQNMLTLVFVKRAIKKYKERETPVPTENFPCFRIGNIELPVANILGYPKETFSPQEVHVAFSPILFSSKKEYPQELTQIRQFALTNASKKYDIGMKEFDDIMVRLDGFLQFPEQEGDVRGDVKLNLSLTTYGDFFATNLIIDDLILANRQHISKFLKNQSIREAYMEDHPLELDKSVLSNPPGVEVCLISRNLNQKPQSQLIIRKRSTQVKLYQNHYQSSATGYMSLAHVDNLGIPSPFVTAITETKQEISDSLDLKPEDYKLLGICIKWKELYPSFYGFIETGRCASELIGDLCRDQYEGYLEAINFTPESVLQHITTNAWQPASALGVISVLLHFYPRSEVEKVSVALPYRPHFVKK